MSSRQMAITPGKKIGIARRGEAPSGTLNSPSPLRERGKEGVGTPQIMVAVGAVIEQGGKVLLVKHVPQRGGFWQGKWICPGGRLKPGEGIEAGIKREVREETNLEVELLRPILPLERIVKQGERVELHVLYIDYLARMVGGSLRVGDDVGEAIWVRQEDLPRMWAELHEDTQRLLKQAGIVKGEG